MGKIPGERGNGIEFEPTDEERTLVERVTGLMVAQDEIARDWIKPPISVRTLRKHFREEITRGRMRTYARLKAQLMRSAENGSVRAIIYLLERFYWQMMPPMPPRRESSPAGPAMPAAGSVLIYRLDEKESLPPCDEGLGRDAG
jgi:hypothetical protein